MSKQDLDATGKFPCILYGQIFTTYKVPIVNIDQIISCTNNNVKSKSTGNEIIFPTSSTSIKDFFPCVGIKISEVFLGGDIAIFYVNKSDDSIFLHYLFSTTKNLRGIFRLTEGSTINHLYSSYIESYKFYTPSLPEQKKIAQFFSLLDKQIELWEKKLQLVELIFKYYMKLILNIDIGLLPKLRFRGFEGEWEERMLSDLAYSKRANSLSKQDLNIRGTFPCILYGEIFTTYKTPIVNINQIISCTNKNVISKSKGNEIIFPTSSTSLKDFFPSVCVKKPEIYLGGDIAIFYINDVNDSMFFHYLFSTTKHLRNMFRLAEGSTINHLYPSYIESYKFYASPSLLEQTKIAFLFYSYDDLLEKINNIILIKNRIKMYYLNILFA